MKPEVIKSDEEHEAALSHLESLMDAEPGSAEEAELELWTLLVEHYEKRCFPVGNPDPIEAIKFRMDQLGMQQKDLVKFIPAKSKISEVLNRKRPLSLSMIREFHEHLGIPAAVLVAKPVESVRRKGKVGSKVPVRSAKKVIV